MDGEFDREFTQADMDEMDRVLEEPDEDEDVCPKSESGEHEIDWNTVQLSEDVELYVDVLCRHCRKSGCIGSVKNLSKDIQW